MGGPSNLWVQTKEIYRMSPNIFFGQNLKDPGNIEVVFHPHMGMTNTNPFSHVFHNGSLVIVSKLLRIHNG